MITLITGGARSGKSKFAEKLFENKENVLYIATAKVEDEEMAERVRQHQLRRPNSWGLFEGDKNLASSVDERYEYYLLDCLTVLCSNHLFYATSQSEEISKEKVSFVEDVIWEEIQALIEKCRSKDKDLIIVTNELGSGLVPMYQVSRTFRDIQGRINQKVASLADQVFFVVSGIPVKIK